MIIIILAALLLLLLWRRQQQRAGKRIKHRLTQRRDGQRPP